MAPVSIQILTLLLCTTAATAATAARVRQKREWIPPPKLLEENVDYNDEIVAKIFSDYEDGTGNINYSLEGKGASQYPFNVFVVNPQTGDIRVTRTLDREEFNEYNLTGVARFADGRLAEQKIPVRFRVKDQNDNPPVFGVIKPGAVDELSPRGTTVMKMTASDADEGENAKIAYSIVSQSPDEDMFYITQDGNLCVKSPNLDREKTSQYVVVVKGQDMNGNPYGKSGTGTVTINIGDVNDNPPTLTQDSYEATIMENTAGVEVMRLQAQDLDLQGTPNWETDFEIASGNEAGYFTIKTDPVTNEGVLMLVKPVNYEDIQNLDLALSLKNKAPFAGGAGPTSVGIGFGGGAAGATGASGGGSFTYPLKINVQNEPEGPKFDPKVKAIPISEGGNYNLQSPIGKYQAIDQDTGKPAENVRYIKGNDPGNWLVIDPKTGEIKLSKLPDRESPLLVNGTYYAEVLCITDDMPSKTATGTVAIQVEDFNDHCPTLTIPVQTLCLSDNAILVNADDEDAFPNGPPLTFNIVPENTNGKWHVEHLNDTAVILRTDESLFPGEYEVEFIVTDQQGESCPEPQRVKVQVCTCEDSVKCGPIGGDGKPKKSVEFGPAGIGLLFLGLLLLLLFLLAALACLCGQGAGTFAEMPEDNKSHLINYRTEGQGENTEVLLPQMQTDLADMGMVNTTAKGNMGMMDMQQKSVISMEEMNGGMGYGASHMDGTWRGMSQMGGSGFQSEYMSREREGGIFDGMALPYHYLGQYYNQKAQSSDAPAGKENLLVYDYEGQGSSAGSLGSCDNLTMDNDLHFLDNLDPKFKTLAEICGGKTEVEERAPAPPTTSIRHAHTAVTNVLDLGPLPEPKPRSSHQAEVINNSQMQEVIVKEVNREVPRVPAPQAPQGQMVFLQQQPQPQPQLYYTTAPVMQPMHYMVQPPVQNMMLVNGPQSVPTQGLVMQGQTVMGQAVGQTQVPGMVLVGNTPGASQTMVLVEGKGPSGSKQVLKSGQNLVKTGLSGSQTLLVVGSGSAQGQQPVGSGSQRVLVMGPNTAQGQSSLSGGLSGSQRALNNGSSGSMGNITGTGTPTSSRRVVRQEKVVLQ